MAPHLDPATQTHLRKQVDDLAEEFAGIVSHETVERVIEECVDSLGEVRLDDYIPVLAYRSLGSAWWPPDKLKVRS